MGQAGLRARLLRASLLGVVVDISASPVGIERMLHTTTAVDPKTMADSQRHSIGRSIMKVNTSSSSDRASIDGALVYASDFSNGAKSEARRELFSIPTAAPTAAVVCQIGDEDRDTGLGCSFDDSTYNDGYTLIILSLHAVFRSPFHSINSCDHSILTQKPFYLLLFQLLRFSKPQSSGRHAHIYT